MKTVMTAAIIPAIVYFASIFFMVDFQAKKLKLVGVPKSELPNAWTELRRGGYLLIPLIVFIIVITVFGRSIIMGAITAIVLAIILSWIASLVIKTPEAKAGRVGAKSSAQALKEGALGSMEDYERLFESLTPEEQVQLASAVRDLSTPVPYAMVDSTAMEVAKANGLSLMDESQLELMTVSQAAYWTERLARESRKAEELARSLVGRKG